MAQALDPFRLTNKLESAALEVITARLEARGHHPNFVKALSDYLDRMAIDSYAAFGLRPGGSRQDDITLEELLRMRKRQ